MSNRVATTALVICLGIAAAGCSSGPRVDTSSGQRLQSSLDKYLKAASSKEQPARSKVVEVLKKAYLKDGDLREKLAKGVPSIDILSRARFEDLAVIAERVDRWQREGMKAEVEKPIPESATERRWRNQFLVSQLKAQIELLQADRDLARYKDLFTIDEFRYLDSAFIPPQDGVPLGKDVATFTTSFQNNAVFSVYAVGFHVVVKDPDLRSPLVDEVLEFSTDKNPIRTGEIRQIELTCCDSFRNQTINLALRQLPVKATIKMDLVSVTDYSKANRLKDIKFTAADNIKLLASKQCEADISSRIDTWTPENADPACRHY